MSKYPSDEFDRVPEYTDRQGVHRLGAGMVPARRGGLWPILVFGIAAIIIGLVAFFLLRPLFTGNDDGASPSASSSPSASVSASAEPSESASAEASESAGLDASASPGEGAEASESALLEPSESAEVSEGADESGVLDRSLPVGVYNGAGISGLAGEIAGALQNAGYTQVSSGNWTQSVEPSVVYYRNDWAATTARDVANELGISTIYQTENIPIEISVVLGSAGR